MQGSLFRGLVGHAAVWAAALLLSAGAAQAHSGRAQLAFWGNFGTATARCQRAVSGAAGRCIRVVVQLNQDCRMRESAGEACDAAAVERDIAAARAWARQRIGSACSNVDAAILGYTDAAHAGDDVAAACGDADVAVQSAVFAPALIGGSVRSVDDGTHACMEAAADAARKLLRYGLRARRQAFDRMAAKNVTPGLKQKWVENSSARLARARGLLRERIDAACPAARFAQVYGRDSAAFLAGIGTRADCYAGAVYAQDAVVCPPSTCGNGMRESGEECDDGNDFEGDGCLKTCKATDCEGFDSTYDLIQRAIFENRGCTEDACHGSARSGRLDLRADVSYESLLDRPAETVDGWKRLEPGSKDRSLLWVNLAARTDPQHWNAPLRGMPVTGDALTANELEALRLWIEKGGASRTASVDGVAPLLSACGPEPKPIQIAPLAPPAPNEGIQMHMPAWNLPPHSESEVCFSSYYDFTGKIPAEFLTPDGKKFRYRTLDIRQNPLSHHLIVDLYRGSEAANDPVWGTYRCRGGTRDGQTCDPLALGFCGAGSECATDPDHEATACIGFGPQKGLSTLTMGGFAFAQETASEFRFPDGVYSEIPVKGVVLWNSHAFNVTRYDGPMEAWVNIYFPERDEQRHKEEQIFNATRIFWADTNNPFPLPELAPFEAREVCQVHLFGRQNERFYDSDLGEKQTAQLFELSGHMHQHGKRFQILRGSFTCKGGSQRGQPCSPFLSGMCPAGNCTDDGGRNPEASVLYTNLAYNDPVVARFDPPIVLSGSAPRADRSLTFCAHYSNGAPPDIQDVKRRSTSPPAGQIELFGSAFAIGGPCDASRTRCIGGPRHNTVCGGNSALCDSAPGAGDGDCDACPLTGGFRTADEMFILFGNYWLE